MVRCLKRPASSNQLLNGSFNLIQDFFFFLAFSSFHFYCFNFSFTVFSFTVFSFFSPLNSRNDNVGRLNHLAYGLVNTSIVMDIRQAGINFFNGSLHLEFHFAASSAFGNGLVVFLPSSPTFFVFGPWASLQDWVTQLNELLEYETGECWF